MNLTMDAHFIRRNVHASFLSLQFISRQVFLIEVDKSFE